MTAGTIKYLLSEKGIKFRRLDDETILITGNENKPDFKLNPATLNWKNKYSGKIGKSNRFEHFIDVYERAKVGN